MDREKTKRYGTIVLTFASALTIGFVMQYGDAVASRIGGAEVPVAGPNARIDVPEMPAVPVSASIAIPNTFALPATRQGSLELAALSVLPAEEIAPQFDIAPELSSQAEEVEAPAERVVSCDISLTATQEPFAMARLDLRAPCRPDTTLALHHDAMVFHAKTDANGALSIDVPALRKEALFIAAFDDGQGAAAVTTIDELDMYDRVVLQWAGQAGLQLHALEFGASYGEAGHVWSAAQGTHDGLQSGAGGLFQILGMSEQAGMAAEVYTFPTGQMSQDGGVELSIEAEVTLSNCARPLTGQVIQIGPFQDTMVNDIELVMPGCASTGEYLLLKNVLLDLKLASR